MRWLELLHPSLPNKISKTFSHELRTKSLKDLHPQILEQIDELLNQIDEKDDNNDISLMYTNFSSKPASFNPSKSRYEPQKRGNTKSFYRRGSYFQHQPRQNTSFKKCEACRAVGEPFIGHSIYNCSNITAKDRPSMLKTFALQVDEVEEDFLEDELSVSEIKQVQFTEPTDNPAKFENPDIEVSRVNIEESPKINVNILNSTVTMVIDTGATGSMIRLDLFNSIGLRIYPSPHSAMQADGESSLNVVGEIHTTVITEEKQALKLSAIVVTKLKAGLIVGTGFLRQHQIVIDFPQQQLRLPDHRIVKFSNASAHPKISLLRAEVNCVIFPGEAMTLTTPPNFLEDMDVAVEPRCETTAWYEPSIKTNESGSLQLINELDHPVKAKKGQIVGQIRSVIPEKECSVRAVSSQDVCRTAEESSKTKPNQVDFQEELDKISVDPD